MGFDPIRLLSYFLRDKMGLSFDEKRRNIDAGDSDCTVAVQKWMDAGGAGKAAVHQCQRGGDVRAGQATAFAGIGGSAGTGVWGYHGLSADGWQHGVAAQQPVDFLPDNLCQTEDFCGKSLPFVIK